MRRIIIAAVALAGCSTHTLRPEDQKAVETFAATEQAPANTSVTASWYADGEPGFLACATITAPPALSQPTLRLVYDLQRRRGQVEMHSLWIAGDAVGQATLAANRSAFDQLWREHCAS